MKNITILFFAIILLACKENEPEKKEFNPPEKVLNIQNADTNKLYICISPNSYKNLTVYIDSTEIFNDKNFTVDFVPAKLVYTLNKSSRLITFHVKIDNDIDTMFNQNLTGIHKVMIGRSFENIFYFQTNLNPMAWVVD